MTKRIARIALALALVCGIARAEAPKTVSVLQLTPDNAQAALAVPPLDATLNEAANLAKKFAPDPAAVDAALKDIISGAAESAEAWGAQSFKEIAAKRGLNGDAPIGVFVDVTSMVKKASEEYGKNKAAADKANEEAAKAAADTAAKAAAAGQPAPTPEKPKKVKVEAPELTVPDLAAVFTVADKALAQKGIDDLINAVPELSSATPKDETVGSVTVKVLDSYGYFFAGDKVVLGSAGLVKGVAAKVDKPGKVSYGTAACPAGAPTEIVELIYGKRFLPLVQQVLPSLALDKDVEPQVKAAVDQYAAMFDSDDPMVVSLGASNAGAILQTRIDSATNKGVKTTSGEAAPLRLAQWLPENTLAMISLRFNAEWKKQITDSILPAVAEARGGKDANQITIAKQVIDQLGDEITIGVAAADQDFPSLFAMVSLAKPDETKGLLQMLVPAMPGEKHADVDIQQLAVPSPIQFSIAYPGDMILLSNNIDGMKSIIDLQKSKGTTKFLASQKPAFDPAKPRYAAVLLNSKLLTDVLLPLSTLGVKLPGDAQAIATKIAPLLHDVRLVSEVDGTWHNLALSVNLEENAKSASAK